MNKKILLKPYHGEIFLNNNIFNINKTHNPFFKLKKKLESVNVEINTIDKKVSKPDCYLYCDVPYPWELKALLTMFQNRKNNILLTFESPLLNPFNHMKFFQYFFKKIYSWNDKQVENKKIFKFYFPQDLKQIITKKSFKNKKFLVMINRGVPGFYKIFSLFGKNNYFVRKRVAVHLSKEYQNKFDLFGRNWKIYSKSYKGEYKNNKLIKLSEYKYCICFENATADGYITEKIFDCFKARCVPVYLGPKNILKYIPQNTFIDYYRFDSIDKLVKFLEGIDEKKYNSYLRNAEKFLKNSTTEKLWSRKSFENELKK